MANYFNTINIAYRALQTQKKSLDVTGHNIANANTEGYSRQRAVHTASTPYATPGLNMPHGPGQLGGGVEIHEITRIRDRFIDAQINEEKHALGYWEKKYEGMERIEMIFNEPSDSALDFAMIKFWESLQDLSNSPEEPAVRETVKQNAQTLIDTFHNLHDQLMDYKVSLNNDTATIVDDINSLADRIADLNNQIVDVKSSGQNPNDLMDERDLLLEEMSELVKIQTHEDDKGHVHVSLGGSRIVSGNSTNHLKIDENPDETTKFEDIIKFELTDNDALIEGGELRAVLDLRGGYDGENIIEDYIGKLDNLARTMVEEFNKVHRNGYDLNGNPGGDFFAETDNLDDINSYNLSLSDNILDSAEGINFIAAGTYSDNASVLQIADSDTNEGNSYAGGSFLIEIEENTADPEDFDYLIYDSSGDLVKSGQIDQSEELDIGGLTFTVQGEGSASIANNPGNGENAVNLANVINKDELFHGETSTMKEAYQSVISSLGVEGQRADRMVNNQQTVVNQLINRRTSVSGVSLDEEMSNMIKYQQAYSAAAQVINTTNQILDTLMGIMR